VAKLKESAAPFVPQERTLPVLAKAAQKCKGCDLYKNATQAVFGEIENGSGAAKPKIAIMMIGEQPGDQEDKQGRPFVGPAGKLLDRALEEAEIDRSKIYVTEAEHEGDQCMPPVAGCRAGDGETEVDCRIGRHGRPGTARLKFSHYSVARTGPGRARTAANHCHAPSFINPARTD
jgi:hypothetical protein